MSDRGFGDHASRNVVKNPLLSTAVIGVSLEDLTHNAVLLPAVPNPELITRQDDQTGSQARTLSNPRQNLLDLSSGDSNLNVCRPQKLSHVNLNQSSAQNFGNNNNAMEPRNTAVPIASVSTSEDDFDVNEYFARLHGTRYVSAPINSAIKEEHDKLATEEENLEEINLNEPDKPNEDFQQSLTADIAQNFSQLPTVLPQVASAVFSSFSNMLNMKSREHTPDVVRPLPDYPDHQIQSTEDVGVPLMSVPDVVKEVAPPPKKPPLGTTSNYRITTKKKMYAQIPGLRSADMSQNLPANYPPTGHVNVPSYFNTERPNLTEVTNPDISSSTGIYYNVNANIPEARSDRNIDLNAPTVQLNPSKNMPQFASNYLEQKQATTFTTIDSLTVSMDKINKWDSVESVPMTNLPDASTMQVNESVFNNPVRTVLPPASNIPVIPPPPMFSNQPKLENQSNIRSVLPPSIARRISANNPVIKQTPSSLTTPMHNIFVPSDTFVQSQAEQTLASVASYPGIISQELDKGLINDPLKYSVNTNLISTSNVIKPTTYGSKNLAILISKEIPQESILENIKSNSPIEIPRNISSPSDLAVKDLSQMNLDPPITNLADELLNEKLKKTSDSVSLPPPTFLNRSAATTDVKSNRNTNVVHENKFFEPNLPSESTQNIPEPPKMSSNNNFRMTKKKPQYYSGPIEGFGTISNNIKPTIYTEQSNTFQGSLYTPQLPAEHSSGDSGLSLTGMVQSTDRFGASGLTGDVGLYQQFDNTQSQMQGHVQPEYNTVFDMSRQTTEYYDSTQQESKGFGIIGSLKTKLSNINLNKLQNSVPAIFNPIYNYTKMDAETNRENIYGSFPLEKTTETQDSSRLLNAIYVPAAEPASHSFGYDYQIAGNTLSNTAGNIQLGQFPSNYFEDQTLSAIPDKHVHGYNLTQLNQKDASPWATDLTSGSINAEDNLKGVNDTNQEKNYKIQKPESNFSESWLFSDLQGFQGTMPTQQFFTPSTATTTEETSISKIPEYFNPVDKKDECSNEVLDKENEELHKIEPKESSLGSVTNEGFKYFESPTNLHSDSIISSQSSANVKKEIGHTEAYTDSKIQKSIVFNQNAADFFDRPLSTENNLVVEAVLDTVLKEDNDNELNICETCREVNKPEEREVENLTDQLIENIKAPIQLSNPVAASLTDDSISDVNIIEFEPNQCAEISHVAEETIETIQAQAAIEHLDDANSSALPKNYGWNIDDNSSGNNVLLEHDYTLQADNTTSRYFQNNSLIMENIPNNASDEIKVEYKNSFDEPLTVFPRQLSIPSAPPAEEDSKSDESGLDVHSIEQDATKDFPIYDDNVIEPSETDDDKIEYREREKSTEDSFETDTFTNRVERYKKMEETNTDHINEAFKSNESSKIYEVATSTSPSTTIASYFDTGNYAVENFYRNSLTSSYLNVQQSQSPMRIKRPPPGFESLYPQQFYIVPKETQVDYNQNPVRFNMPEYNANPESSSVMYSYYPSETENNPDNLVTRTTSKFVNLSDEILTKEPAKSEDKLPDFATVFAKYKEHQDVGETSFSNIKPETIQAKTETTMPDTKSVQPDTERKRTESPDVSDFSRLSSYFTAPTQTDPSKSFFELSQSENHYRHNNLHTSNNDQRNLCDKLNIPHEKYVANMSLIKDLTSTANIDTIPKEQTVRSVNYFTILYDNDSLNHHKTKVEPIDDLNTIENVPNSEIHKGENSVLNNETNDIEIIEVCKHCCSTDGVGRDINNDISNNLGSKNVKIRQFMNKDNTELKKDVVSMENKKEKSGDGSFTVNFENYPIQEEEKEENVAMISENRSSAEYSPVKHHWFYRVDTEGKSIWKGFSTVDSDALENAFVSPELSETTLVPTDGGRFDVNVEGRLRVPVYWSGKPSNVMRCSWFYKGTTDARYVPYSESVAEKLEEEYKHGVMTGEWHRRLILPNGELVVMHGPTVMVHFLQSHVADAFSSSTRLPYRKSVYRAPAPSYLNPCQIERKDHLVLFLHGAGHNRYGYNNQSTMRPRVVRRGVAESEIEDMEPSHVDHLLLLCHGVGSACDMRFRPVEEVVDDFRATSLQLIQSHYKNSYDSGVVGRIEVLPISWHSTLHSGEQGVDKRLAQVTLDSIPRLRNFTNDTVLDVLFYTSPVYCQTIIDTVCKELNRIYGLFKSRNPSFDGGVSLGGHSLGSVILYDLLCHQKPLDNSCSDKRYVNGTAGTGQPTVKYPRLEFKPDAMYALGSPIAIFECIRGVELLGSGFCLPTCKKFFNIFHPYDPIAYRIEPLINPQLRSVKPFQIPHHKGRKRMHLELKDTMARVGADIKQKVIESIKSTWSSVWKTQPPPSDRQLEKVVEEEIEKEQLAEEKEDIAQDTTEVTKEMLGKLNDGRRVDYVLQEAPFEMINEYLFAMSSHVGYWESEDTMLLMLREVYDGRGVRPDGCVPQQTMTLERTRIANAEVLGTDYPSTSRGGI